MGTYARAALALLTLAIALSTTLVSACGASPPADVAETPVPAGAANDSSAPPATGVTLPSLSKKLRVLVGDDFLVVANSKSARATAAAGNTP